MSLSGVRYVHVRGPQSAQSDAPTPSAHAAPSHDSDVLPFLVPCIKACLRLGKAHPHSVSRSLTHSITLLQPNASNKPQFQKEQTLTGSYPQPWPRRIARLSAIKTRVGSQSALMEPGREEKMKWAQMTRIYKQRS